MQSITNHESEYANMYEFNYDHQSVFTGQDRLFTLEELSNKFNIIYNTQTNKTII